MNRCEWREDTSMGVTSLMCGLFVGGASYLGLPIRVIVAVCVVVGLLFIALGFIKWSTVADVEVIGR